MNVQEAIASRYSVRSYQERAIEEDKLQRVLAAAVAAPTARNRQQWRLIVARDPGVRRELAEAADQPFLAQAPVVLAIVGLTPEDRMSCQIPTDPVDCAIVLDHVVLTAVAEGLGCCWIGHFDQDEVRRVLRVPAGAKVVQLMPMGYPSGSQPARKRKGLDDLIAYDRMA